MVNKIIKEALFLKNHSKARILQHFFKTGKGEYGEGDKFLGLTVPLSRSLAKKYKSLSLQETLILLKNPWHEIRLIALLILVEKYNSGGEKEKDKIFKLYLKNTKFINNWDLVDLSAYKIIGRHLMDRDRKILFSLSASPKLWERRISIVSTFHFIKNRELKTTFSLSKKLLFDKEDLMHKAVGWMLREAGKRDVEKLISFLDKHSSVMPRTMLRYAIEKLPKDYYYHYLQKPRKMIK